VADIDAARPAMIRAAAERVATTAGSWIGRLPPLAVDLALAAALLVAMVTERVASAPGLGDHFLGALVLSVVIAGSLAGRRRAPLAAYALGTAALIVESLWLGPGPLSPYPNLIGLYSLGHYGSPARARLGPVLVLPGVLAYFAPEHDESLAAPVGVLFVWLLAWAAGYSSARRREQTESRRRLMRREAVIDERVRIARDLHDVIGHAVNAMLVQAGAGRMVLDTDPDRAREMLAGVERTGRNALGELDRVLGALRADDDAQPGLDDLDQIVRPMLDAGMAVHVRIEPAAQGLPRSLELSAYRIVQEGLTNALRHGRARSAEVVVAVTGGAMVVEVRDDGRGPAPGYQPGRGLLGIGERAGVFGGTVQHGHGPGTGFTLRAELPLP
jgi:signal transduction histidine kinase